MSIHEEDASLANRHRFTKHEPALPLYTEADAFRSLSQLQPVGYEHPIEVAPGITIEFRAAGHLLGSAFVLVTLASGRRVLFGGDLGRYDRPVLPDPSAALQAHVALVESTYGDREHLPDDDAERLAEIIRVTAARGGRSSFRRSRSDA